MHIDAKPQGTSVAPKRLLGSLAPTFICPTQLPRSDLKQFALFHFTSPTQRKGLWTLGGRPFYS